MGFVIFLAATNPLGNGLRGLVGQIWIYGLKNVKFNFQYHRSNHFTLWGFIFELLRILDVILSELFQTEETKLKYSRLARQEVSPGILTNFLPG